MIDRKGLDCTFCHIGTLGFQEDIEGFLTCLNCLQKTKRWIVGPKKIEEV
jgi:hypothetical protein